MPSRPWPCVGLLLAHGDEFDGNAGLACGLLDKRHGGFGMFLDPGGEILADRLGEWRLHNRMHGLHNVECGDLRIDWCGNRARIGDGLLEQLRAGRLLAALISSNPAEEVNPVQREDFGASRGGLMGKPERHDLDQGTASRLVRRCR